MFGTVLFITPEPPGTRSGGQLVVSADVKIAQSLGRSFRYIGPNRPEGVPGLTVPLRSDSLARLRLALTMRTTPLGLVCRQIEAELQKVADQSPSTEHILVFIENTRLGFLCPIVRRVLGPRAAIVFNAHNVELDYMRTNTKNPLRLLATYMGELQANRMADLVLTLTREDADRQRSLFKSRAEVRFLPVALPVEPVYRPAKFIPEVGIRCLFVGKLDVAQNERAACFLAQQVLPAIPEEYRSRIEIVLAGASPGPALIAMAREAGLPLRPDLTQNELEELFSTCHVLLAPVQGGSGIKLKVMDALARGLSVIGSGSAIAGYEDTQEYAVLATSPAEYAAALVKYLEEPERLQAARDAAYRTYATKHTTAARAGAMQTALEQCLGAGAEGGCS